MGTIFLILILVGAVFALATGVSAIRTYLRYRRARAALQERLAREVASLAKRTGEIEKNLAALDTRAQQLPVRISELHQSLATLRTLTGALAVSLRQIQGVLSFSALKTLSSTRISELIRPGQPRG